jgi:hypothetical protein
LLNATAIRLSPGWVEATSTGIVSSGLKLGAAVSLTIWICALLAGRWIAFL